MYIQREIESTIKEMLGQFKVVLVAGARQVGKTTVLVESIGKDYNFVSLEDPIAYQLAESDPVLFFQTNDLPLIIDEIQRVSSLFQMIKFVVDQSNGYGQVALTGSQTYELMQGVSESLAGRIGILEMPGLSLRELRGNATSPHPYVPEKIKKTTRNEKSEIDLWTHIQRGAMPRLYVDEIPWDRFWSSYVRSYLERDVRTLVKLKDERKFFNFMIACAARTGQLFNASDIANAIDVDSKTVQSWISILRASGIVSLIYPFSQNVSKRVTKSPKIYFMDTGLVSYLTRWTTPEQLRNGATAGHVFETFVVSEIIKSYMNAGAEVRDIWFYRDLKKHEIDLVIQKGHVLHPVEIKTSAMVGKDAVKNFTFLEGIPDYEVGFGHVICQIPTPSMITENVQAVPVWAI